MYHINVTSVVFTQELKKNFRKIECECLTCMCEKRHGLAVFVPSKTKIIQTKYPPVGTSVLLSVELGVVASVDLLISRKETWLPRFCDNSRELVQATWLDMFENIFQQGVWTRWPQVCLESVPHQSVAPAQSAAVFQLILLPVWTG